MRETELSPTSPQAPAVDDVRASSAPDAPLSLRPADASVRQPANPMLEPRPLRSCPPPRGHDRLVAEPVAPATVLLARNGGLDRACSLRIYGLRFADKR